MPAPVKPQIKPCNDWAIYLDQDYSSVTRTKSTLLDIRIPKNNLSNVPLIVYVHGGGWTSGDKADNANLFSPLIKAGWAIASVNYRMDSEADWPAMLYDVKGAVRYLRKNATKYKIDPNYVFMFGASAGAHITAMCANTNGNSNFERGEYLDQSSNITAAMCDYGPLNLRTWAGANFLTYYTVSRLLGVDPNSNIPTVEAASPFHCINNNTVPTALRHGTSDTIVNVSQSTLYRDKLISMNIPTQYTPYAGAEHAAMVMYSAANVQVIHNWFRDRLAAA